MPTMSPPGVPDPTLSLKYSPHRSQPVADLFGKAPEGSTDEEDTTAQEPTTVDPDVGERHVDALSKESLAAFEAAQARAGIVYLSRIPPAMRPSKVRHLIGGFGAIGRVYLQQEGQFSRLALPFSPC